MKTATEKPMLAFHGNPSIKRIYLARVKAHRKADELIHGTYWQNGKGCAVGCTVHSSVHQNYETELGIPAILARLEDRIFESLKNSEAQKLPEQFLSAPRVGADLSMVWPKFALWLLADRSGPVFKAAKKRADVAMVVADVAALYREWIKTGTKPAIDRWSAVRSPAAAAAAYASYVAAYAAAYAAYAASAAASAAAAAAAAAYAYAAADAEARAKFWRSARDKLLSLMRSASLRRGREEGR